LSVTSCRAHAAAHYGSKFFEVALHQACRSSVELRTYAHQDAPKTFHLSPATFGLSFLPIRISAGGSEPGDVFIAGSAHELQGHLTELWHRPSSVGKRLKFGQR
jgi:hypothetical protein